MATRTPAAPVVPSQGAGTSVVQNQAPTPAQIPNQGRTFLGNSRSKKSMRNFTEKWPTTRTAETSAGVEALGDYEEVDFLMADETALKDKVLMTCIREIASPGNSGRQLCAFYLAGLNCVFTDLSEVCHDAIKQLGGRHVEVRLPSQSESSLITLHENADPSTCLLLFGQMVLVLFKNISSVSYTAYTAFMKKIIVALRAHIGMAQSAEASAAFSFERAALIRAHLGSSIKFKKELLSKLIHMTNLESVLGNVCTYLTTILSWTDMAPMVLIHNTLLVNNSPVLRDSRVLSEAINLANAFQAVNKHEFPQYFRILASIREQKLLERSRFPTLIAVAQKLRSEQYATINQFVMPSQCDAGLVEKLVAIHKAALQVTPAPALNSLIDNLVDFGESEEQLPNRVVRET